jgi:hypothetical protein
MSKSDKKKKINQAEAEKMLRLSTSTISELVKEKVLKCRKIGGRNIYNKASIDRFLQTFNIDDYLIKDEIDKKLARWGFTSTRVVHWANIYDDPLGFALNGKKLINGIDDIPPKYRLTIRLIGDRKYYTRASFAKALNWMRGINHKVNPKPTKEQKEHFKKVEEAGAAFDREWKEKAANRKNVKKGILRKGIGRGRCFSGYTKEKFAVLSNLPQ